MLREKYHFTRAITLFVVRGYRVGLISDRDVNGSSFSLISGLFMPIALLPVVLRKVCIRYFIFNEDYLNEYEKRKNHRSNETLQRFRIACFDNRGLRIYNWLS